MISTYLLLISNFTPEIIKTTHKQKCLNKVIAFKNVQLFVLFYQLKLANVLAIIYDNNTLYTLYFERSIKQIIFTCIDKIKPKK